MGSYSERQQIATLAAIVVGAVIASQHEARQARGALLPSTPSQWVEQFTAASLDNPGHVCRQLFAPALAAVFKADTGRSCVSYYSDVNAKSFRIRHVLVDGNAAAVEVREVGIRPNWGYVTMLLSHLKRGWQAVDIVPGGPVRPDEAGAPRTATREGGPAQRRPQLTSANEGCELSGGPR